MSSSSLRPTPQQRDAIHFVPVENFVEQRNISRGTYDVLTIFTELSVKLFRQMVVVFFFRTENRNKVELYHLQNTGKSFAFTRDWHWKSTQMVQKISVVLACVHPFFLAPIYFLVPATQATVVSVKAGKRFQYLATYHLFSEIVFEFSPELPGFPYWNDKCSFPDGISSKPRSARFVFHLSKPTFYTIFRP